MIDRWFHPQSNEVTAGGIGGFAALFFIMRRSGQEQLDPTLLIFINVRPCFGRQNAIPRAASTLSR
jgi:hypothetical protein